MKKGLIAFVIVFMVLVLIKYYTSNYNLEYKVGNYSVKETYKNNRLYYEINNTYNFDIYMNRKMNKTMITKIKEVNGEDFKCIVPYIKKVDTYPLCVQGDILVDYHLIDNDILDTYKSKTIKMKNNDDVFSYYNNLNDKTYIAIWNYKGYIIVNEKNKNSVALFDNERYDNSLSYLKDDTIYMPNYDEEHEFSILIALNVINNKKSVIELKAKIDYDSYIVGSVKDSIYIFDNKYSILYEFDTKKQELSILSDSEKGYVRYDGKNFVSCSKGDYKVDKINFDKHISLYEYSFNNKIYKSINDNKSIKMIIHNKNIDIIHEYQNTLYYVLDDYLYRYTPKNGSEAILYSYELTFNTNNTIYIYNK